jgi:hypothetical protein
MDDYEEHWKAFYDMVDAQDFKHHMPIKDYGLHDDLVLLAKVEQLNALSRQLLILRIACAVLVVLTVAILVIAYIKPYQT